MNKSVLRKMAIVAAGSKLSRRRSRAVAMTTSVIKSLVAIELPLVLGVTMMVATEAHAFDQRVAAGRQAAMNDLTDVGSNIGPIAPKVDPDPTDDGSIIIECVVFAAAPYANVPENNLRMRPMSMPQYPLGPSRCWPQE